MDDPTIHEDHWRWRTDDGGEGSGGATFHELEDVDHTFVSAGLDVNVRLRFSIHVEVSQASVLGFEFQYNRNGAGWFDVDDVSSVARSSASTQFADNDATTEHGVTFVGSGSFVSSNEGMDEINGLTGTIDTPAQDFWACEFCFQIREADVADGDAIEFRLLSNLVGLLDSYPPTNPTADISLPVGIPIPVAMANYRRRHEMRM